MVCRTCPQSGWPPASARVPSSDTRLDTVSDDQFLLRTPGSGWPGDGHGRPLDRPVGRTSPVQWDHLADGSGPGPDSDGQAADTSSAQRPTIRLASRPRPTTRPTRPGPDRTGQQCAYSPSANPSHGQHRDPPGHHHLHLCSMPGRPQAWCRATVPLNTGRYMKVNTGVSLCPRSRRCGRAWRPWSTSGRPPSARSCPVSAGRHRRPRQGNLG
jgi:hypothetical protein